ncbi:conserved hypothetical protein [Culex quinquefasciatus]|uniref:Uncharacterized protein n=1 Tax=Culex quinquefasciatus TaxID=7176 RepID=B0WQC4_CULQU|nr:conserved hypothetical protein [Culex quinquefasciatus]|eukprot:XP_001850907.1 conserved hypothetical protein [Culex quinquefasciatus]
MAKSTKSVNMTKLVKIEESTKMTKSVKRTKSVNIAVQEPNDMRHLVLSSRTERRMSIKISAL